MDRVAVVTGASRGIGAATALVFAERGFRVVVNHRSSAEQADEVVQAVTAAGGEAVAIRAGNLFQVCVEFFLMAIAVFLMVKMINSLKRTEEAAPPAPPAPPREEVLLAEIRDLLALQAANGGSGPGGDRPV